ncbi:MAG: hypothetical protein AAGC55_09500, partial [Myxococcota bacterium]
NIGDTGQIATTNMDFEIQLVADQEINRKYALVRQSGGGFNPGNLLQNDNRHRGFFTESIKIWIDSQTSSLSLHAHAPETSTSSSTYSSSTGWTAGVSGGDVASLSYSSSSVVSTTITDFKTINNTAGVDPAWEWALAKVSGKGYNNWKDIYYQDAFEKCKMYSLPDKAKSNLTPKFEAVFKADSGFNGNASFLLTTESKVRKSKARGDIWKCKQSTDWHSYTRWMNVTANFGLVSVD